MSWGSSVIDEFGAPMDYHEHQLRYGGCSTKHGMLNEYDELQYMHHHKEHSMTMELPFKHKKRLRKKGSRYAVDFYNGDEEEEEVSMEPHLHEHPKHNKIHHAKMNDQGPMFFFVKGKNKPDLFNLAERQPEKKSTIKSAYEIFVNDTYMSMSAKYSGSKISTHNKQLKKQPHQLVALSVDEEVPKKSGVIIVNEKKFKNIQSTKFARNEACQEKLKSSAIFFFDKMTDKDFSTIRNQNVSKSKNSWILKNEKTGEDEFELSPYVMWDKSTSASSPNMIVSKANGFPSIDEKEGDSVLETGYMMTTINKKGAKIYGVLGGKKGKTMKHGQSLFYGDALIYPSRAKRMPVWIRLASKSPSEVSGEHNNISVDVMSAKLIPLNSGMTIHDTKEFTGEATRKLKVSNINEETSDAFESGDDVMVINASLRINFNEKT